MWFKVDDGLALHAKVVTAGNEAMGLWVRAGAWCSAQLTGGHIPTAVAQMLAAPNLDLPKQLVVAGLWDETPDGYVFHDWDDCNPSAEIAEERRRERSAAGRRGAQKRWSNPHGGGNDG